MMGIVILVFVAALFGCVAGAILISVIRERRNQKRVMASASRAIRHLTRDGEVRR